MPNGDRGKLAARPGRSMNDRAFAFRWIDAVRDAGCACGERPPEEAGTCPAHLIALGAKRAIRKRWPGSLPGPGGRPRKAEG